MSEPLVAPGRAGGTAARRPTARRTATRERVLDAAREVFAERGVIGGTVEDICERAGFTRGAFYSNFADKDDVLRALIAREHARLLDYLDATLDSVEAQAGGDEEDALPVRLARLADGLLRSVPADRLFSLVQTELEIHAIRDPRIARPFIEADARFRARIAGFLDEALRRLGRELVVGLDDATDAVIAIVERSIRRALLAGGAADPDELARVMLPPVILAVSRPVGSA